MGIEAILKLLQVYLLASVKYFLTFPYALIIGLDFTEAVIVVTIGGISGFVFFYYLSEALMRFIKQKKPVFISFVRQFLKIDLSRWLEKKATAKKPFVSKRIRKIIKLKERYGFWGIIIMSPILISIPIGAFLLNRYYSRNRNVFAYMTISILGWAVVFSAFFVIFPHAA